MTVERKCRLCGKALEHTERYGLYEDLCKLCHVPTATKPVSRVADRKKTSSAKVPSKPEASSAVIRIPNTCIVCGIKISNTKSRRHSRDKDICYLSECSSVARDLRASLGEEPQKEDYGLLSNKVYPLWQHVDNFESRLQTASFISAILAASIAMFYIGYEGFFATIFIFVLIAATVGYGLYSLLYKVVTSRFPELPKLKNYKVAHDRYVTRLNNRNNALQSQENLKVFRKKEKEDAAAQSEKLWRSAVDKKNEIHASLTGIGTYRLDSSELLRLLDSNRGEELEHVVAGLLRSKGWVTNVSKVGPDGGLDVVGERISNGRRVEIGVQVKHWESSVSNPEVRDFWGACVGVFEEALFVTSSKFTNPAKEFMDERNHTNQGTNLQYWEGIQLSNEIDSLSDSDYEAMLHPIKSNIAKRVLAQRPDIVATGIPFCPKCRSLMTQRRNRNDGSKFYGCTRYPSCNGTVAIGNRRSRRFRRN